MNVGFVCAIPVILADESVSAVNLDGELDEYEKMVSEVDNSKTNTPQGTRGKPKRVKDRRVD